MVPRRELSYSRITNEREIMRKEMIKALIENAKGNIALHKMNVEVYFSNPAGIGEHSDVMEAVQTELKKIAEYHDQLEVLEIYFNENQ